MRLPGNLLLNILHTSIYNLLEFTLPCNCFHYVKCNYKIFHITCVNHGKNYTYLNMFIFQR